MGLSSGELPPLDRQLYGRVCVVVTALRVNEISWWLKPGGVCSILSPSHEAYEWAPKVVAPSGHRLPPVYSDWLTRDPEAMNHCMRRGYR